MTPSGSASVGLRQHSIQSGEMYHFDVGAQQGHIIAEGLDSMNLCYQASLPIAWAGFAALWPQIYAYVHRGESAALHAVNLVDAQAHKVIGSWTFAALNSHGIRTHQHETHKLNDLAGVFWSPNSKHLAVRCQRSLFLIMSF